MVGGVGRWGEREDAGRVGCVCYSAKVILVRTRGSAIGTFTADLCDFRTQGGDPSP